MTAEPRTKEPDIWLQEYEAGGRADCGCRLDSAGPDGMLGAALYYCPMHDAAPETAAERDRLRGLLETAEWRAMQLQIAGDAVNEQLKAARALNKTLVEALEAIERECVGGFGMAHSISVCTTIARSALAAAREGVQG